MQGFAPARLQSLDFTIETRLLFRIVLIAPSCGFVVVQLRPGRPDVALTALRHPQAKVDIVECDFERLVQLAYFLEHLTPDDQARSGDRGQILAKMAAMVLSGETARHSHV